MELRAGWNFHNDIAISLEGIAREFYRDIDRPVNKIYDADGIEGGFFSIVMIHLLLAKKECNLTAADEKFIDECYKYINKRAFEIKNEDADSLFKRFKELF